VRNVLCDLVTGMLDFGTGPGKLVLMSKTNVPVATLTFSTRAFAPAVDGVAIANEVVSDASAVGGIIANALAVDGDGNAVFACDVSLIGNGGTIQMSALVCPQGQSVSITDLRYTAPP
jgi:hypothetical protein